MAYVPQAVPPSTTRPKPTAVLSTQVELRIACRNLLDRDVTSKSDPMCVIYGKDPYKDHYIEVGRTETIKNTVNPDFVKPIPMSYNFEEHQKLRFDVYDSDYTYATNLQQHDYLGRMDCSLGEIVSCQGTQFKRKLNNPQYSTNGIIIVTAEEVGGAKEILTMQFAASGLDKKDVFGKSDPFLTFSKTNEDNSMTVVHKTEVVKNTLNPTWRHVRIPTRVVCNGDLDRSIVIHCYDWDSDGDHDLIGEFKTNARTLMKGSTDANVYQVINPKKAAKKSSYKNSGIIKLMSCTVEIQHSFLDYIQGGTQLHFTVAVDFTGSNGDPRESSSLHYQDPSVPNAYITAIRAVGEIIADYDSDKMFPALGFGARLPPDWRVSHEFFLNGSPDNPYCNGVDGILAAYMQSLYTVQLYGPTNFSPVINHVARFASAVRDGSAYFVLLIITDGVISDMLETKRAIVNASTLPMSVIIVGVGFADFKAMEALDGDAMGLSADGRYAQRDVVQFVAMRDFLNTNVSWEHNKARLAKEVLAEIPNQLVTYMTKHSIRPRPNTVAPGAFSTSAPPTFVPS